MTVGRNGDGSRRILRVTARAGLAVRRRLVGDASKPATTQRSRGHIDAAIGYRSAQRQYGQYAALTNAKLNPSNDALILEDAHSPYVNFLVGRPDNKDAPAEQKLAAALTSPDVRKFIADKYHGAVVPAF
jgi:ABC-type metal ion transport system substrate-binding protein